ncbi:pectate lyase [Sunxiuqinia indica]|uniref:pectate lyase n=1 Tax=Sunxiuqinia indica TaxID=2692584 RepID=UPI0013574721|nr:pectate lyase [Sunxiuqinia indica]
MNKYCAYVYLFLLCFYLSLKINAQECTSGLQWKEVVYGMDEEWYGSEEAVRVAENVLLYQCDVGGWPKNKPMHMVLSKDEKEGLQKLKQFGKGTATIDNGATVNELIFLSKVYHKTKGPRYKDAFLKGINYLFEAQYENGGWPQFYPLEEGDYSTHITFNDNAMVNVMSVMKSIAENDGSFSIELDDTTISNARKAFDKGIDLILKTQYKQNGELTAWCAQYDEHTLLPAKARTYELPSLSGNESVGIVLILIGIDHPSLEVVNAVQAAVTWFDKVKIEGIRIERYNNAEGKREKRIVKDKGAPTLWARFYELKDNRPFFCDRDGIKRYSLTEIGRERRAGYGWYDDDPKEIFKEYKVWQPKWAPGENVLDEKLEDSCIASDDDKKQFDELCLLDWEIAFSDNCTGDWKDKWLLDGKVGYVENSENGMALYTGPKPKISANDIVLWTKQSFSGDLMIDYDYIRIDDRDRSVNIIYIEATGSGKGEYGKNIQEWINLREFPAMPVYYNNMNTLHISYAAFTKEGDYIRARRYRPDLNQKLEGTELGAAYNTGFFDTGVRHHITIIKKGYKLYMKVVNDEQSALYIWNYKNHPEIFEGPIGLRHKCVSAAIYKNFVVRRLSDKNRNRD